MNELSILKITGHLDIVLTDAYGNIKETRSVPNLIVDSGKQLIAERLLTTNPTSTFAIMSHMALGTSGTGTAGGNTALGSQWGARQVLSPASTRSGTVLTYTCTFGASVPDATTTSVQEAGIFNALTGGTMLCRTVFGTITKASSDVLTISWNVTIN